MLCIVSTERRKGAPVTLAVAVCSFSVHPDLVSFLRDLEFRHSHCVFQLVIVDPKPTFGIKAFNHAANPREFIVFIHVADS